MAKAKVTIEDVQEALYLNNGNKSAAAKQLGISRTWLRQLLDEIPRYKKNKNTDFHIDTIPQELRPVEDLIRERKRKFKQKHVYEEKTKLIPIKINLKGPIGIWVAGDPHVDDDGTNLIALEEHINLVNSTEGLFAANVGDTTNNWVGRLARLYADQSTSASEAWQLCEWFISSLNDKWLFIIGGNHDCWSGAADPLKWMTNCTQGVYKSSEIRLKLQFPNKQEIRINCHHDFSGNSQWNPAHGSMKAAQMGFRDHILLNGHKHISGYGIVKCPSSGIVSHCVQIASYKVYDRYAREKGFRDQNISPCVLLVIDPYAKTEVGCVTVFHDPHEGAEFLTYKRKKFKETEN